MNESNEAPEILEAHWSREQVQALFEDLDEAAEIHHVQVRASAGQPQDCETTLDKARKLFDSGQARAIQIRYVFADEVWCDTLMVTPTDIRVIRTRNT